MFGIGLAVGVYLSSDKKATISPQHEINAAAIWIKRRLIVIYVVNDECFDCE